MYNVQDGCWIGSLSTYLFPRQPSRITALYDNISVVNVHPLLKLHPPSPLVCRLLSVHRPSFSLLPLNYILQFLLQHKHTHTQSTVNCER